MNLEAQFNCIPSIQSSADYNLLPNVEKPFETTGKEFIADASDRALYRLESR